MKIKVTKDNVTIDKDELYHAGEYNIHDCIFEFSEEYTDILVKKALFGVDNKFYEMSILNNQCEIPYDVLKSKGMVILGVYAYEVLEDKLKLRYSPMYDKFFVNLGSYQENIENQEEITTTQFEQYMQALQNGLAEVQSSIDKLNKTTDNANNLVDEINKKVESGEFDGVGITTITSGQATQQDDSTVTQVTVNKTDGSQQTFNVSAKNGINGTDGTDGTNGQDGITPNLQIGTVTTLEPNEQATVTRTGTDEEPLFNFGIPRGQTYQVNNEDLKNIANQITSNANSEFNKNVDSKTTAFNNNAAQKTLDYNNNCISKTNSFNQNSTQKLTEFNDNYTSKLNSFNSNADLRMDEYNENADNKIAEYDEHSQELNNKIIDTRNELERVKNDVLETGTDTDTYIHLEDSAMAEYQELSVDGVCEQETTSIANGDEYDSPSPDYPQPISVIENSLKITSCNKNLYFNDKDVHSFISSKNGWKYLDGTGGADNSDQTKTIYKAKVEKGKTYTFSANITSSANIVSTLMYDTDNQIARIDGTNINYNNTFISAIDGYVLLRMYINSGITVNVSNVMLEQNPKATSYEQHLESQITANLPEGEFIGKINDTYKDTLKVEYNEEDGQYHLNLYKRVYKNNSYNGESYNYYISTTSRKDGNIECGELQTGQVVYYDGDETIIDLGICDMPITYNEITNLFTDSDLMPQINAKYYKNFISTIQNLQVNKGTLKEELVDIENRLTGLEENVSKLIDDAPIYGIQRNIADNSDTAWERTDDAVGLVANATHDGTEVRNDFDNIYPWSHMKTVNYDPTEEMITATIGDSNFKFDGSNGQVMTIIPEFYLKHWDDGIKEHWQISRYALEGFTKVPGFMLGRYVSGRTADNKLISASGLFPEVFRTITAFRTDSRAVGKDFGQVDWRYFVVQLLYLVEYADYNSQAQLGNGYTSLRVSDNDKALVAETNANRIIIGTANANYFKVGQAISVGTKAAWNWGVARNRIITSITDYSEGDITGKAINFDGSPVNIAIENVVWSTGLKSGACDSLGMKSGCLANDSKSAVIYRGLENIFGNVWQFVDGINIKDYVAYVCYNPANYVIDKFDGDYNEIGYTNASTNGYGKTLGHDENHPLIMFPTEVGGSTDTYLSDYYNQAPGNRIALVGGRWSHGAGAGLWYWNCNSASSLAGLYFGSRLLKSTI